MSLAGEYRCLRSFTFWPLSVYWKFLNYYGHPSSRLSRRHSFEVDPVGSQTSYSRSETLPGEPPPPPPPPSRMKVFWGKCRPILHDIGSLILRVTSVLLFDAPTNHFAAMQTLYVDRVFYHRKYEMMIENAVKNWAETSLLASVLWTWVTLYPIVIFISKCNIF